MSSNNSEAVILSSRRSSTVEQRETLSVDEDAIYDKPFLSKIPKTPSSYNSSAKKKRHSVFLLDSLGGRSRLPTPKRSGSLKGKEKEFINEVDKQFRGSDLTPSYLHSSPTDLSPLASKYIAVNGQTADDSASKLPRPIKRLPSAHHGSSYKTDPATLVNLALQLSQSRARAASVRFSPYLKDARANVRAISLSTPDTNPVESSKQRVGSIQRSKSINTRTQAIRQEGQNQSEVVTVNGYTPSHVERIESGPTPIPDIPGSLHILPSPQTLIRAERAQIALELRYQHRRLLKHLPRLPVTNAKGHKSSGSRGELARDIRVTRSEEAESSSGQLYNPIQYARNRRTRYRERIRLDSELGGWKDVERVKSWIDGVERESGINGFSFDWQGKFQIFESPANTAFVDGGRVSMEGDEISRPWTRIPLPPSDWVTHPWELLADAYWVQKDNNKTLLENRNGEKLFPKTEAHRKPSYENSRTIGDHLKHSHKSSLGNDSVFPPRASTPDQKIPESRKSASLSRSPISFFSKHGSPSKHSVVRLLSKKFTRAKVRPSSSDSSSENCSNTMFLSGAFGNSWQDEVIPDSKSANKPPNRLKSEVTIPIESRRSLDVRSAGKASEETRHPFSLENKPPEKARGETQHHTQISNFTFSSDVDSNAPSSPANSVTFPNIGYRVTRKRGLESPVRMNGKDAYSRLQGTQSKDFASGETREAMTAKPLPGLNISFRRKRASTLSSPSETSFSAASDNHSRKSLQIADTEKPIVTPDRDAGFHPLKNWKAGVPFVRAKGILRRKEAVSETASETDDELHQLDERDNYSRDVNPLLMQRFEIPGESSYKIDGPRYHGLELPTFRSSRPNGSPSAKDRKPYSVMSWQKQSSSETQSYIHQAGKDHGTINPAITVSPAMSRTATDEHSKESSASQSRPPSIRRDTLERRGAIAAGMQWSRSHRTDTDPWPGQDRGETYPTVVWTGPELSPLPGEPISSKEVARLRAITISTFSKAHSLKKFYHSTPTENTQHFKEIRSYRNEQQAPRRIDEPLILSSCIGANIKMTGSAIDDALSNFVHGSQTSFQRRCKVVKDHLQNILMEKAFKAGDEADSLGAKIAGECTLEVKELNDRIDSIWRARRRRSRWLRRIIFALLEWLVLSTMWGLWFIVICVKTVNGTVNGTIGALKWLLWL